MRFAPLALAAAFALTAPAFAHDYKVKDLQIGHPWSRPAAAGMTGAGYLTIANHGAADRLTAVETAVAERVEIHLSVMSGGVARMNKVQGGLAVGRHQTVALKPGGAHLMLIKLKQPLKVGDKVPATLVFQKAGRVPVVFMVQAAPPAAKPEPKSHH